MICFNGAFLPEDQPLLTASNRSFKYGDGLFETMRLDKGQIRLANYHFDRLFTGLDLLQIGRAKLSKNELLEQCTRLCLANDCADRARIRLAVFRNNQNEAEFVIGANAFPEQENNGWTIGIYPFARKHCDAFANLKSANYLPYVMADLYAKEKAWHEAIVLNGHHKICDGSKTNIFLIKEEKIVTPALHQGCVHGVMRRFVIDGLKQKGLAIHQTEVSEEELLDADEVFLTNALRGIIWVKGFGEKQYGHSKTMEIIQSVMAPLYQQ